MAERVTVELVDDLDGSAADETVHFTWDGKALVVDLNKKNADKLRKAIEPFVAAARPDGTQTPAPRRRLYSGTSSGTRQHNGSRAATSVIRAWARENSIEVPDRGRLKPDVVQAWEASRRLAWGVRSSRPFRRGDGALRRGGTEHGNARLRPEPFPLAARAPRPLSNRQLCAPLMSLDDIRPLAPT